MTAPSPAFTNFLQALIERHRMPVIFRIRTEFDALWDEERKLLPVQITSAVALDEDERQEPRRADRQADRPHVELSSRCRSRHPRRDRAAGGQLHPRRLDPEPTGTTSKASRAGVGPRLRRSHLSRCRSSPTRSPQSSRAGSRASTPPSAELTEVGTVLSVADGICRIHGLENCMSFEMLELPHDVTGAGAQPGVRQRRRRAVRRVGEDRRGRHGQAHRAPAGHPRRRGAAGADRRPARQPARRQGRRSTPPRPGRPSTRRPASSSASRSRSRCSPA